MQHWWLFRTVLGCWSASRGNPWSLCPDVFPDFMLPTRISGALYSGLCKDLVENQLMDSSLIGLARVNLSLAQSSWLLLCSYTEDFRCCFCPKGGWLFLETTLGVGEGQHPCILWSEPSRASIWLSPPDFPLKRTSLGFGICMLEGYGFIHTFCSPGLNKDLLFISTSLDCLLEMLKGSQSKLKTPVTLDHV